MRNLFLGFALLAVTAISLAGCASAPPGATAEEKASVAQANFDQACKYAGGVVSTAQPVLPLLLPKLGANGTLALKSAMAAVLVACNTPLDINNSSAIIQRVYDAGGQVVALIIQAKAGGG